MKVQKFHQFVHVEKGPVNSMVIDFLQGQVFHVSSNYIDLLNQKQYEKITECLDILKEDKLIIEIDEERWVPSIAFERAAEDKKDNRTGIDIYTLEIDKNVDLDIAAASLSGFRVSRIFYYGETLPEHFFPGAKKEKKEYDFSGCQLLSCIDEEFQPVKETEYDYNMQFNSCWGGKVAVCDDLTVRPCIYSKIIIGDVRDFKEPELLSKSMKPYWELTKDNVERCKDCEFRYACFDCREIAYRRKKNLIDENPNCPYNPHTGAWEGEKK